MDLAQTATPEQAAARAAVLAERPEVLAAREEVVTRRRNLLDEIGQLSASFRNATDIPAQIRRSPAKAAGIAAGAGFLALGGPRRAMRAVKGAVRGPAAERPKSLLPDRVEKIVHSLGGDGDAVRATLETEFAGYLDDRRRELSRRTLGSTLRAASKAFLLPISTRAGREVAKRLFSPGDNLRDEMRQQTRGRGSKR